LVLNGQDLDISKNFEGQRINLPKENLSASNELEVIFRSKYRNDGTGIHSFTDDEDQQQYLYTQFEAFEAHRAWPCFDQPSIRAELEFRVIAPADWAVVGNSIVEDQFDSTSEAAQTRAGIIAKFDEFWEEKSLKDTKFWIFKSTPKITPYLFAFAAGPYVRIQRQEPIPGRDEPLQLDVYCRGSLKADCEKLATEMVDSTVEGIKFYSKFFGFDFPYQKYDQLFCPEFKFGAMENVGCVTFTENLLFRGQTLGESEWSRFINVVLHELCHQWFGNLVTMEWWNDLWLNESFATFVSFLCMDNVPRIKAKCPNLWSNMNMYKNWGMETDELATNHPICKDAPHTDSAQDMINGITYGKGCSFLK